MIPKTRLILATFACFLAIVGRTWSQSTSSAKSGQRPYEMVWPNRTQDEYPPLVDFEGAGAWQVEAQNGAGSFQSSTEERLWGNATGKLNYSSTGDNTRLRVLMSQPGSITEPVDALSCWIYGSPAPYADGDLKSPPTVSALFANANGSDFEVSLGAIDWKEWFLVYRRLTPNVAERLSKGATFKGFVITGARNHQERSLFFDNLAVFKEVFAPLSFEPRPARGIALLPGGNRGTNTGPGKLSFPTREQTILPDTLAQNVVQSARRRQAGFEWTYNGSDGQLTYHLNPQTGMLDDVSGRWLGTGAPESTAMNFRPCAGGGVYLWRDGKAVPPEKAELTGSTWNSTEGVGALSWKLTAGSQSQDVTYRFRMWGKSLVVDVLAPGGGVAEVRYGRVVGLPHPRLVTNPYYLYSRGPRPAVVVAGTPDKPLFFAGNTDWYLSNATQLFADNDVDDANGVLYNGGARYIPRTDGVRNGCTERLFLTLSPRYEEVLPNIPNPKSPYMNVTGTRLWRSYGSGDRKADIAYWEDIHRYGMTQLVVLNHETMWRDGYESFTFRTKPAPGKGGDQGEYAFARAMQDKLGFIYGPYNNYTDLAPVNEYWKLDMASRLPDGGLRNSWFRCYGPKPARAVEYAARLPFEIQKKFHYSAAYCDVHTAVAPWGRVDSDARVPGAGTFGGVFYNYGEILQLQKQAWQGPVFSEGGYHVFYSGLTDGNYAQDPSADLYNQPWFVDFDLRKMHPLSTNFGMGAPGMFGGDTWKTDAGNDRFLAATVAFGHTGYLTWGTRLSLRSYYMLQQLQSRYTLSTASEIRYADAEGKLWDTSDAVARDVVQYSQIVTRYANGTITAVNGNKTKTMNVTAYGRRLSLVPNGYAGWTSDGNLNVLSNEVNGAHADYSTSPAYTYIDGRGTWARFSRAASSGVAICRNLGNRRVEIIPIEGAECGFAVLLSNGMALNKAGKSLGPAQVRVARGLSYVVPVAGAFSYTFALSAPTASPTAATETTNADLTCPRDRVVAGEKVVVLGRETHNFTVPSSAKVGERIWQQFEGKWIDFTVVPALVASADLKGDQMQLSLTSNFVAPTDATISFAAEGVKLTSPSLPDQKATLRPGVRQSVSLDLGAAPEAGQETLVVTIAAGGATKRLRLNLDASAQTIPLVAFPEKGQPSIGVRGQAESNDLGASGANVEVRDVIAGGVTRHATFMHPAWQGVTGYTFALYSGIALPSQSAKFSAFVGKGDGSSPGDGIVYKLAVVEQTGAQTVVSETTVTEHEWKTIKADLSRWAGKTVSLKLITDPGGDTEGDWGAWAEMRLDSTQTRILRRLVSVLEPNSGKGAIDG